MKSPEQQLVDLFHKFSVQRFNHTEFARLLSEQDELTQRTFFLGLTAFISYKSAWGQNYPVELNPDSLVAWCMAMDKAMGEYSNAVLPNAQAENNNLI